MNLGSENFTSNSNYKSIVNCEVCSNWNGKFFTKVEENPTPNELKNYNVILDFLEYPHSYASNATKFYKCPICGTYYYYNHYKDEGEHFMDPTYDEITIRRYTILNMKFILEGTINQIINTLPNAPGQLAKAFFENYLPDTETIGKDQNSIIESAKKELQELLNRYNEVIEDFKNIIQNINYNPNITEYIIQTLCEDSVFNNNMDLIDKYLLENKDLNVKILTTDFLIDIASENAAVLELIHINSVLRTKFKKILKNEQLLEKLAKILIEGIFNENTKIKTNSLNILTVLLKYYDVSFIIPRILTLLGDDNVLNDRISWLLHRFAELKIKNAELVIEELKMLISVKNELQNNSYIKKITEDCHELILKKSNKKNTKKN